MTDEGSPTIEDAGEGAGWAPDDAAAAEPASPSISRRSRCFLGTLWVVVGLLTLFLSLRLWVLTPYRIPTASMEPVLRGDDTGASVIGDTVLVYKLAYAFAEPKRWDIVAFEAVSLTEADHGIPPNLVKRIVGLPGERVEIDSDGLRIDGARVPLPEDLGDLHYVRRGRFADGEVTLGANEYFVLGDNSYLSQDSRQWGPLPRANIFGRVVAILQPAERARWLAAGSACAAEATR